jgi:hypothetical protein
VELGLLGLILGNVLYLVWANTKLMQAFRAIEATASRTKQMTARMLTMVGALEEKEQ